MAPVSFRDVAACFSEEEWTLLHQWQKELYKNVMTEIHQALSSLGPLISTAVFSLRGLENESPSPVNQQELDRREVEINLDIDTPITSQSEEPQCSNVPENLKRTEVSQTLSTDNPIITSVFSLCHGHDEPLRFQELEPEVQYPAEEEKFAANPEFASTFSLLQFWEEKPLVEDSENTEENTGNGSMNRNGNDRYSLKCTNVRRQFEGQSKKMRAKVVQISEERTSCGSQLLHGPNQKQGRASTSIFESGFNNLAHSSLRQGTYNAEQSAEHVLLERSFGDSERPTYPSNVQKYTLTESGELIRQREDLTIYQQPPTNPKRVKRYQCTQCEKSFNLKASLLAHSRTHIRNRQYPCTKCEKLFSMKAHLVNHQRFHTAQPVLDTLTLGGYEKSNRVEEFLTAQLRGHDEMPKSIEMEQNVFQNGSPETHSHIIKQSKLYKCSECDKSFNQKGGLLIHYRTHTGEKPYHCSSCQKNFAIKAHLVSHERSHTGERPFKCTGCEKTFSQKGNLMVHFRRRHDIRKNLDGKKSFVPRHSPVAIDINTHGGSLKPFPCSQCERSFRLKAHLFSHLRSHLLEKPYQCNQCEKRFSLRGNLMIHIRRHDEKRTNTACKRSLFQTDNQITNIRTINGEKPYQCTQCEKQFKLKAHLANHQKKHTEEKPFQCAECKKGFNVKASLRVHIMRHHKKNTNPEGNVNLLPEGSVLPNMRPHQCRLCEQSFRLKAHLATHEKRHERDKPYQCTECQKRFNMEGSLRVHIRRHHPENKVHCFRKGNPLPRVRAPGEKLYQCTHCEQNFRVKAQLVSHQRSHNGEKRYKCNGCEKRFSHKGNLMVHFKRFHENRIYTESKKNIFQKAIPVVYMQALSSKNPFQCTQCEKSFRLKAHLGSHKRKHKREKNYQCTECEKSFSQQLILKMHLKRHHPQQTKSPEIEQNLWKESPKTHVRSFKGKKAHPCTQCDKSFHRKNALLLHFRAHESKKQYKCTTCQEIFRLKTQLILHQRVHKEKLFHCATCEKTFSTNAQLVTHERVHTGEKPYNCTECEKSFTQKGNLLVHISRKHKTKKQ